PSAHRPARNTGAACASTDKANQMDEWVWQSRAEQLRRALDCARAWTWRLLPNIDRLRPQSPFPADSEIASSMRTAYSAARLARLPEPVSLVLLCAGRAFQCGVENCFAIVLFSRQD